ncbi:MAG TPA: DUF4136 domain-containing protein [Pyrinomonadaceae bacterium]|nr:DUF4136 domain-containing protein [Pyrinomonadaceae bacterium]
MKRLIIMLLILFAASSVHAQKVKVGADPSVDISKYKTYGWATPMTMGNPIILATTIEAIDEALAAKGLTKVDTNPELTIAIFTSSDSDLQVAYPGTTHNTGSALSTGMAVGTQRWTITKGTLMVDIADAKTNNSVWRATATHTLERGPTGNVTTDAKTVARPIRKAVEKMFKQFPRPS